MVLERRIYKMSSSQNLNDIFIELNFTDKEKEGFNQAIQVAKDYLRNGDVNMEKQFKDIVEKVIKNEV